MIRLPEPKQDVLARRDAIVAGLRPLLRRGGGDRRAEPAEALRNRRAVRLPPGAAGRGAAGNHRAGRRGACAFCHANGVRVVPRGAGTSLSGGALPLADAVVVGLMRMNRILDIDYADRCATVQAGVTNIGITNAVAAARLLLRARSVAASSPA